MNDETKTLQAALTTQATTKSQGDQTMTDKELWDLATDIGNRFEAIREAIADLRKELEAATAKLLDKNTIRNAESGSFYGKQPSATQVFAAIHLAQAIDKVHAAEWSFGGEINGARNEALNAIVALSQEEAEKAAKEAAEEVCNA